MSIDVEVSVAFFDQGHWTTQSPALTALLEDSGGWDVHPSEVKSSDPLICCHQHTGRVFRVSAFPPGLIVLQDWNDVLNLTQSFQDMEHFAAMVSHDLTEPLKQIAHFTDQAASMTREESILAPIHAIQRSSQRLNDLISGLLTYARIQESGRSFLPVDMKSVVQHVIGMEKCIHPFECTLNGVFPIVFGDRMQIELVIQNLISNAIKFQPVNQTACIQIRAVSNSILIEDNGIGFDPKYRGNLFKPFRRLVGRSQYQGAGLGLAICRRIMDRHGGSIDVQSRGKGKGTCVNLRFPSAKEFKGS